MASKTVEGTVGTRVYKPFSPRDAGIITENHGPEQVKVHPDVFTRNPGAYPGGFYTSYFQLVTVKWLDGTTTIESSGQLNDFDALIADHEKKLATHNKTLEKLKALEV